MGATSQTGCGWGKWSLASASVCYTLGGSGSSTYNVYGVIQNDNYGTYKCLQVNSVNTLGSYAYGGNYFTYQTCDATNPNQLFNYQNGRMCNAYSYCVDDLGGNTALYTSSVGLYGYYTTNNNNLWWFTGSASVEGNIVSYGGYGLLYSGLQASQFLGLIGADLIGNSDRDLYWFLSANCGPGTYLGNAMCVSATAGYYVATAGLTAQTACPNGTYSNSSSSSCTNCTAGYYCTSPSPSATQNKCGADTYSYAGASSCTACTTGYYCMPGANCSH